MVSLHNIDICDNQRKSCIDLQEKRTLIIQLHPFHKYNCHHLLHLVEGDIDCRLSRVLYHLTNCK